MKFPGIPNIRQEPALTTVERRACNSNGGTYPASSTDLVSAPLRVQRQREALRVLGFRFSSPAARSQGSDRVDWWFRNCACLESTEWFLLWTSCQTLHRLALGYRWCVPRPSTAHKALALIQHSQLVDVGRKKVGEACRQVFVCDVIVRDTACTEIPEGRTNKHPTTQEENLYRNARCDSGAAGTPSLLGEMMFSGRILSFPRPTFVLSTLHKGYRSPYT